MTDRSINATERFSNRVSHYVRARPGYPSALIDLMKNELGLRPEHEIADVGSGTGILTEMLLRTGCVVYAVEPNAPMRQAAEERLANYPNFHSIDGSAEATNLQPASIDFITAAQAFHWFDPQRARGEFLRILRSPGHVVLVWNDRRTDRPEFSLAYEEILRRYNTDMDRVHHRNVTDDQSALAGFFLDAEYQGTSFANHQDLDWEGAKARMLSSSYMPAADDPRAASMLSELQAAFDAHQSDGIVRIEYETRAYWGRLRKC